MSHSTYVQVATDLLSESRNPEIWLAAYDLALASDSDDQLNAFIGMLWREQKPHVMAA